MIRWNWTAYALLAVVVAAGCASTDEPVDEQLHIEDCVSEEGQRLLTFCASTDAARLAERQHAIARSADQDDESAEDMVALPVDGAPVRGQRDAAVTVHLFSDLTCRDCRTVYRRLAAEVDSRPGDMRMVFRHTPASEAGDRLARAAVAAGEQGRFWEFVDEIYEYDEIPDPDRWPDIAETAGLDVQTWQADRRSPIIDALLERDALQAEETGVVEAPTFFVNGIRNVGGVALQDFDEVLGEELDAVESMRDAGLEGAAVSWRRVLQNFEPVDWKEVEEAKQDLQRQLPVAHLPVGNSPQRGAPPAESLVTVVVFADFLCPYSAESARIWNELLEEFAPRGLRIVFKHFPLGTDPGSELVAAASVVAQQGGVFWDFHDEFFFGDTGADPDQLESTLRRLGWAGEDFHRLLDSPEILEAVDEDRRQGREAGVEGTPTIFVNGIRLEGVLEAEQLAPLVADQIELAKSVADLTGKQGEQLYRDVVEANRRE